MRRLACALLLAGLVAPAPAPAAAAPAYRRVSVGDFTGAAGADMSANGKIVTFVATGTKDNVQHVYAFDAARGTVEQIDLTPSGRSANGNAWTAQVSADGRYVVFSSAAPDLVPGDKNNAPDAFLRDRVTRTTRRVSLTPKGGEVKGNNVLRVGISGDGQYVFFETYGEVLGPVTPTFFRSVYRRHVKTGRVDVASIDTTGQKAEMYAPVTVDGRGAIRGVSHDGRYVAFVKQVSTFPVTVDSYEVLVRDMKLGRTVSASTGLPPVEMRYFGEVLDAKGEWVLFGGRGERTGAFHGYYLRNLRTGALRQWDDNLLSPRRTVHTGDSSEPAISADGKYLFFSASLAGDPASATTPTAYAVYQFDVASGSAVRRTTAVTVDRCPVSYMAECNMPYSLAVSQDGAALAFATRAPVDSSDTNGTADVYLHR